MDKAVLILGGGGIGTEVANQISRQFPNKKILIACRNAPSFSLEGMCFIKFDVVHSPMQVFDEYDIDSLIVTAGIGRLNFFDYFSDEEIDRTIYVNTIAAIKAVRYFYGRINSDSDFYTAVITSIAGMVASPLYSVYSASKAALVRFIEGVNAELRYYGRKNRILNVAPGFVGGTGFHGGERTEKDNETIVSLSQGIVSNMLDRQEIFIPHFEDIYKDVLFRYKSDGGRFADESLQYKLCNNTLQNNPPIKTGYLTGTFDLFHIGHLNLLRNAKSFCDRLIVGVHPDASHKNKTVFVPLEERIQILRSVRYVDDVLVCGSEDTDEYELLKYDYLFVGTDYKGSERFQRYEEFFSDKSVKIIYLPYTGTTSSTQLRQAISKSLYSTD